MPAILEPWPQHWPKTEAVLRLEPRKPPQRARKVQLPWCDELYRCIYCVPNGQTRPISSKQCKDPVAHMPTGIKGQYVHFLSSNPHENILRSGDPKLYSLAKTYITSTVRGYGTRGAVVQATRPFQYQSAPAARRSITLLSVGSRQQHANPDVNANPPFSGRVHVGHLRDYWNLVLCAF